MPLNDKVVFDAQVNNQNRFQIPKLVRWQYKLESSQILKVTISVIGSFGESQSFLAKMRSDGRITIPRIAAVMLHLDSPELKKCFIEVTLDANEPIV